MKPCVYEPQVRARLNDCRLCLLAGWVGEDLLLLLLCVVGAKVNGFRPLRVRVTLSAFSSLL